MGFARVFLGGFQAFSRFGGLWAVLGLGFGFMDQRDLDVFSSFVYGD